MALRLGRMTFEFVPTSFGPYHYSGTFWDTATSTWVIRTYQIGTAQSGDDLVAAFEADYPGDTFDWSTPAPPAP